MSYTIYSIDGDVSFTRDELIEGVGTDWSDVSPMPVEGPHGEDAGAVDPATGEWSAR